MTNFKYLSGLIIALITFMIFDSDVLYSKKPFTHEDAMKFKSIRSTVVSDNGKWIAYTTVPDRGDGSLIVISPNDTNKVIIPRGERASFSKDGNWLAAVQNPKSIDIDNAKTPKDKPKSGIVLLRNSTGITTEIENVSKYQFSNNSKWLLYQKNSDDSEKSEKMKKKSIGSELNIRHLASGTEIKVQHVSEYFLDSACTILFYAISSPDGKRDGIYWRNLREEFIPELSINKIENNSYSSLAWNPQRTVLAYISTPLRKDGKPDNGTLMLWEYNRPALTQFAVTSQQVKNNMFIPSNNSLKWTDDGQKLYFGVKPIAEKDTSDFEDIKLTDSTYFNTDSLLSNADDLIWHWKDDRISTNQVNWWGKNKNRTFACVYDVDTKVYFQLGDENIQQVIYSDNSNITVAYDEKPYIRESTWGGWYYDLYVFDLNTGVKKKIAEKLVEQGSLSPLGKYVVFFKDRNWYVYDPAKDLVSNMTAKLPVPFYDEDNDMPMEPGSYGIAGWFEGDNFVLVNEKYDLYRLYPGDPGSFLNQTGTVGRKMKITFRYKNLDPDKKVINNKDTIYLHGYSEKMKSTNIFLLETQIIGGINISAKEGYEFVEGKNFFLTAKPKNVDYLIYTRESFDEFPDLWMGNIFMDSTKKLTDVNPQMKDFKWGTTEPVRWKPPVGDTLDGYLIKPDGFDPKKKYPVLVYYYERFSEQTYRFYQPRINHRPIYQVYLGEDYLVFVPDVRYRDGRPGTDAVEAITSGVQTLIDRGIADPKKLCIQGHSWAGYQTAYIVTQTDMFAAASAGAPVGNMTSAYSQIRTESGLARQFQYEKYQSRIGGNLWDSLDSYLRNSPVFQVQKAKTPLLILHGNVDEAVPFAQGVELYLAYRRLSKNCVLVEYKNEPHHPRKYENKLDWAIKMKEWYDHYVLGKPAAKWITEGRIYMGNK